MRWLFALSLFALAIDAGAQTITPQLDDWKVPWPNSRPRDPDVDRNGIVWFVGQTGDYVAAFDPKNAQFRRIDLERGTGPHNLILGEDGAIWYSGNRVGNIGRLDPEQGIVVEKIALPAGIRDPHTLIGDGKGHIWFTAQASNTIGRLTLAGHKVDAVTVPTPNSLPYGIAVDARGRPWANLLGTNELASVDPKTLKLERIATPRKEARTRRVAVASDGAIWYTDYAAGHLGRFDPKTRKFSEWALPSGAAARPYAMAIDDRQRVWVADSGAQPNHLLAFDMASAKFVSDVEIKNANGAVRHMVFHAPGRALWFGTDTDYLVRVKVP
ncbi:MAG: lyase [Steroidobacteraceae bacterium]